MKLFETLKRVVTAGHGDNGRTIQPVDAPQTAANGAEPDVIKSCSEVPERKCVLFVDDDLAALKRFEHTYHTLRNQWEIHFTSTGKTALDLMSQRQFDVIVADLEMPNMDGVELLNESLKRHPQTARFLRCDVEERSWLKKCNGTVPLQMARECDAESLGNALTRALRLNVFMANPSVQLLIGKLTRLPSLPLLYTQVNTELAKPDGSIEFIGRLIAKDPAMTAKILQAVNSADFALSRQILDPKEAVMHLGAERTKSVLLLASVCVQLNNAKCEGFSHEKLWMHSMATGASASAITMAETKDAKMADMAFTAGLLHDVGKLLLASNLPDQYVQIFSQSNRRKLPAREIELEAFGATHAELAACLLGNWGLPLTILEAIAWHHCPIRGDDKSFSLVTAVHAANAIEYEKKDDIADIFESQIDDAYIAGLGLVEQAFLWRKICGCPKRSDADELALRVHLRQYARHCVEAGSKLVA